MTGLHTLIRKTERSKRRVGRGQSSGRGKTSGRGTKGQSARAGNKKRPELRDIIKKIPKRRGFGKNRGRTHVPRVTVTIPLARLETLFTAGDEVSTKTLIEKGVMRRDYLTRVKVVGTGALTKKLSVRVPVSDSARVAIEKTGGSVSA
jgi:large subunit ribosomal protein L15